MVGSTYEPPCWKLLPGYEILKIDHICGGVGSILLEGGGAACLLPPPPGSDFPLFVSGFRLTFERPGQACRGAVRDTGGGAQTAQQSSNGHAPLLPTALFRRSSGGKGDTPAGTTAHWGVYGRRAPRVESMKTALSAGFSDSYIALKSYFVQCYIIHSSEPASSAGLPDSMRSRKNSSRARFRSRSASVRRTSVTTLSVKRARCLPSISSACT